MNACTAIVGINWGDEGKGRMVDLLTEAFDVVIRYQGGGNAGHTVINQFGEFEIHSLPSGVFRKGVVNVIGNGAALDPEKLLYEIRQIQDKGVSITPENLMISERASLLLPWHRAQDGLEELRLGDKQYGSSRLGIAPFYSDKHQKKTVLAPFALTLQQPGSVILGKPLFDWPKWTAFISPLSGIVIFGVVWLCFRRAMRHYRSTGS